MTPERRIAPRDAGHPLIDGAVAAAVANRAIAAEVDRIIRMLTDPSAGEVDDERRVPSVAELRETIWHLRRLLKGAAGPDASTDLARALRVMSTRGPELERALVVWVQLVEVLVQDTERRLGRSPGRGGLKKAEVREVIRRLLVAGRLPLPRALIDLRPIVIDTIADMSVDVIVLVLNRHGAWIVDNQQPDSVGARVRAVLRLLLRPLWRGATRAVVAVREAFRRRPVLSPRVRRALEAVEREGLLASSERTGHELAAALDFVVSRRHQIVALVQLVLAVVEEAERYTELTGPEKRAYAENLIMALLADLGLDERAGLLYLVLKSLAGSLIEAAVQLYNRRGVFENARMVPA